MERRVERIVIIGCELSGQGFRAVQVCMMYRFNDSAEILRTRYQLHGKQKDSQGRCDCSELQFRYEQLGVAVVWTACAKIGENQPTLTDTCYPLDSLGWKNTYTCSFLQGWLDQKE